MSSRHPSLRTLQRFAALDLATAIMVETGRHVFTCRACRARLRREILGGTEILRRLGERFPTPASSDYDEIFGRIEVMATERFHRVSEDRQQAIGLLAELDQEPLERQREMVGSMDRFWSAALVTLLLDRCRVMWKMRAESSESLAELALAVADRLDPALHGHGLRNDLRARAWAFIGNSRRIQSNLRSAGLAFEQAERILAEGSTDPLEQALVLDFKASLLRNQRQLDQALETIQEVVRIYRRVGDRNLEGRALVSQAIIHGLLQEQEKGIELFYQAIERIVPAKDPHLVLTAYHNLVVDLVDTGRVQEASALFPDVQRSAIGIAGPLDMIRILWLEGMIDSRLSRIEQAVIKFQQVREQFMALSRGYETAMVSLDLAKAYLLQGKTRETKQLAVEMHALFAAHEIHREAIAAIIFFQRAAEQEAATVQLVEQVMHRLKLTYGLPDPHQHERPA